MSATQDIKKMLEKKMLGTLDSVRLKLSHNSYQIEQKNVVTPEQEEQLTIDSLILISESFTQLTQFCLTHSQQFEKFEQYRTKLFQNRENLRKLRQKAKTKLKKALLSNKKKEQVNDQNQQVQQKLQNTGYLSFYNQKSNKLSDISSNKEKATLIATQWKNMSEKQRQSYIKMANQKQLIPQKLKTQLQSKQINAPKTQKQTIKAVQNKNCKKGDQGSAKQFQSKEKVEETSSSQLKSDILSDSMQFYQPQAKVSLPSKRVSKVSAKKQKKSHKFIKILHKQKIV